MEQLVKEEAQKHLANQIREARVQRQKQVRQQALAWTEATRRKFEEAKEREIKSLAGAVTGEVQNAAIKNIEELTRRNDLAMAEIGMAHRAAAGYQNVERLKSLKRLKNDEVATNRGSAAMTRHLKQKEAERSRNTAILKRKEEVRKSEDKLSKDLISRRPLKVTNSNTDTKVKLGPPEYQQSIAKTLKVASTSTEPKDMHAQSSQTVNKNAEKGKTKGKGPKTAQRKSVNILASSSSDLLLGSKRKQKSKDGLLQRMVRIKTTSPAKAGLSFDAEVVRDDFATIPDLYGIGYKMRSKYITATKGSSPHIPTPLQSNVRYFDATIPKGEVKYVAPPGLVVKEGKTSPDAWEKGRKTSEESLQHQRSKSLKEEELAQKAAERGKVAMKKAKLEKEILEVRNELLEEIDYQFLGTGSQKAILGLDDSDSKPQEVDRFKELNQSQSSDEFSAVESDEEYNFPSPPRSTVHNYDVKSDDQAMLTLKRKSTSESQTEGKIKESSSTDSFDSYSTPSLHSIEDEVTQQRKMKAQRSLESVEHDMDKVSPHSKQKSKEKSNQSHHKDAPDSSIKQKGKSDIEDMASSVIPEAHEKRQVGDSFSDDPTVDNLEDNLGRKLSSKHASDKKAKTRKPSGSKSAGKEDGNLHRKKSGSSSELFEPISKSKESITSKGSYSPPSLHSSEEKVTKKQKSTQPSKKKKSKSKAGKTEKSTATEPMLDKMVETTASLRQKSTQSVDEVKSTTSIGSSKSSGAFEIHSKTSSSSSTIAEINVRTRSGADVVPSDKKVTSLQELHSRAKEQEKLLGKSLSSSSSLSDIQHDSSGHLVRKSAKSYSLVPSNPKSSNETRKSPKEWKELKQISPQSNASSSSHTDSSGQSSALVNIKIKQIDDSSDSQTSRSRVPDTSSSKSDESSALVNLKILEQSGSTPSRTERSSSTTTDYYSPPDGPYTSTPDGKLHPKSFLQRSADLELDNIKRRTLYYYLDKFLKRRPDSIEHLPVSSSSSSSVIRTDSDVIESESFPDVVEKKTPRNDTTQSTVISSLYSSSNSNSTNKGLSTLQEESSDRDRDSGTTIAEAAIVAGIVSADQTATSTDSNLSHAKGEDGEATLTTERSSGSLNGAEQVSSDSLTGLLRVLSNYQEIEKHHLDYGDVSHLQEQSTSRKKTQNTSGNSQSHTTGHDSSRDSIPDASAILRRLMSRQRGSNSSKSSASSSPKSGPEREAKRVELLDDVTPIKLWETPPQTNQTGANDTEKLAAVFENLIDKWSNMRIEKPPWTPFSDSSQKEDNGE